MRSPYRAVLLDATSTRIELGTHVNVNVNVNVNARVDVDVLVNVIAHVIVDVDDPARPGMALQKA
jgi:hypothetical protein